MFFHNNKLQGRRVAILATDGFEQDELFKPREALLDSGADITIVSLNLAPIRGWRRKNWGDLIEVDKKVSDVSADLFDALVLPGGVMNPDSLRKDKKAVEFVRGFVVAPKPIAAICHGPWTLIEAGGVAGRKMTSWPSLKSDLRNAGAAWIDEEVVVDNGLVTSRKPDDLPAFIKMMIEEFHQSPLYPKPFKQPGVSAEVRF